MSAELCVVKVAHAAMQIHCSGTENVNSENAALATSFILVKFALASPSRSAADCKQSTQSNAKKRRVHSQAASSGQSLMSFKLQRENCMDVKIWALLESKHKYTVSQSCDDPLTALARDARHS